MVFSADVIGYDPDVAPSWCWIDPNTERQTLWQYVAGKLWEILAFVVILVLYSAIKVTLWKQVRHHGLLSWASSSVILTIKR